MKQLAGQFTDANGSKIAIVIGRFNSFVVEPLLAGAVDTLTRHGVAQSDITVAHAPGAWELPLVAQKFAQKSGVDAVIVLGAVIRGSTPHFDYVAGECAKACGHAQMQSGKPVVFGVLTTDSIEQAIERCGTKAGNKGCDAAMTAIEMISLLKQIG